MFFRIPEYEVESMIVYKSWWHCFACGHNWKARGALSCPSCKSSRIMSTLKT